MTGIENPIFMTLIQRIGPFYAMWAIYSSKVVLLVYKTRGQDLEKQPLECKGENSE